MSTISLQGIKPVCLVIADISGYTRFLKLRTLSLLHAEEVISTLLEAVVSEAEYPLQLSKFEGDAVFLYAVAEPDARAAARDVYAQIRSFFNAFHQTQAELIKTTDGGCVCEACRHIGDLRLKAIVHSGQALFKRIRNYEELAGEDVILVHRLLKNSVDANEYIAASDAFYRLHGGLQDEQFEQSVEHVADLGNATLHVLRLSVPDLPAMHAPPLTRLRGVVEVFARTARAAAKRLLR
jgi:class 3 adenylate cyclase